MAKRRLWPILLLVVLAISLGGCVIAPGRTVEETREVSGFNRVVLSGVGHVNLTQGDAELLTVRAPRNVMRRIRTEVRGDTLYLEVKTGLFTIVQDRTIEYDVTVKEIEGLRISGSGSVESDSIQTGMLEISVSGSGDLAIDDLDAERLELSISGSGNFRSAGRADIQLITISGSGEYRAGDLQSQQTTLKISGSGNATVWVEERLDITISGSGDLAYYGNPRVSQRVSGSGSIRSRGDR
jgi:hypothetical protein